MSNRTYYSDFGGLPPQSALMDTRAVFTDAYAVLPASTMSDITASLLPFWSQTRLWVIARPLSGFSETFSHYIMDVSPSGGSQQPEPDAMAECVLFVVAGEMSLSLNGTAYKLAPGGYAFVPPGADWTVKNEGSDNLKFHWVRKRYQSVEGLDCPQAFVTSDHDIKPVAMPDTQDRWATTRFADPADLRHDMHVNIVTFQPGGVIPFPETHVMEHGLFVLEGKAAYKLNQDWVEVEAGDYLWLRAFCPQACYAGGQGPFRDLLYKDVNRHAELGSFVR